MNSFFKCHFEGTDIINFKAYQTLFEGCVFARGRLEGLKAQLTQNRTMKNSLISDAGVVQFRDCRFESFMFDQCYFEGVVFERCSFAEVGARSCKFDGITSDVRWWSAQKADPFAAFLIKALELIAGKCGKDSAAYQEFENYVVDFGSGKTTSKDFSACLYSNRVPYVETQKIIKDLRKLVASFPL